MKEVICEKMDELYCRILLPSEIVHSEKSEYQQIDIIKTPKGKALVLDGSLQIYTQDEFIYHEMLTHLPMIHHPNPERVLILGGGDGFLLREVLKYKSVKQVVMVDLDKRVVDICKKYFAEETNNSFGDPRLELVIGDALDYVMGDHQKFDVVIMDLIEPYGIGEKLYTEESLRKLTRLLKDDGIFATHGEDAGGINNIGLKMHARLSGLFPYSKLGLSYIRSFDGLWAYSILSNKELQPVNKETAQLDNRYFEASALDAHTWIPPFLKRKLEDYIKNGFEKFEDMPGAFRRASLDDTLRKIIEE